MTRAVLDIRLVRAMLERHTTLDDLFGFGFDLGIEADFEAQSAREELDDRIRAEQEAIFRRVYHRICREVRKESGRLKASGEEKGWPYSPTAAGILIEAFAASSGRCRQIARLRVERHELHRISFWRILFLEDLGIETAIRASLIEDTPSNFREKRTIKIDLFPTLGQWLTTVRWSLEDLIRWGKEAIRRMLDGFQRTIVGFARWVPISVDQCLVAIVDALAKLKRHLACLATAAQLIAVLCEPPDTLLTPHVIAAGGGLRLFVTRC